MAFGIVCGNCNMRNVVTNALTYIFARRCAFINQIKQSVRPFVPPPHGQIVIYRGHKLHTGEARRSRRALYDNCKQIGRGYVHEKTGNHVFLLCVKCTPACRPVAMATARSLRNRSACPQHLSCLPLVRACA